MAAAEQERAFRLQEVVEWFEGLTGDVTVPLADAKQLAADLRAAPRWRPASEPMPADGFVLVEYTEGGDDLPEVWAASTYANALKHGDTPGWSHLFAQAKALKRWLPLASLMEA